MTIIVIPQYWGGGWRQPSGGRRHGCAEVHHRLQSRQEERVDHLDRLILPVLSYFRLKKRENILPMQSNCVVVIILLSTSDEFSVEAPDETKTKVSSYET